MILHMSRFVVLLMVVTALACSGPRYRVSGGENGAPLTRVDTHTGETQVAVQRGGRMEWRPVHEKTPPPAATVAAALPKCTPTDKHDPYRDLFCSN